MKFIGISLRRPITILVGVFSIALLGIFSIQKMPRDILPDLNVPVLYIAQPYGGMDPSQMEGYLTYYYEYHFLFIPGIESMQSRNIQGTALIKLQFHPGTNMAEALAQTINYVSRARAYMPPGTLAPFIMRFDAGAQPVGNLVFTSEHRSLGELQDYALNYVRPLFATLPGVSAPAPFGASQRAVVVHVDPAKLRSFNLSPYDVAEAVSAANKIVASGNLRIGKLYPTVPLNSVIQDINELQDVPLRTGTYPTVFLKDVATIEDGTDIQTGYAWVNGRRAVYIPVTKRSDASTLAVVDSVKKNIPKFQSVLPDDVKISYEFDQSGYVRRAIASLVFEGVLGALLAGLMVLLFFREWRSALIVVCTIPLAILGSIALLGFAGQTINVMTLGGLALGIGILVDEVTVIIENIHAHLARGQAIARAARDAASEVMLPQLLTLLCILAVFIPALFMTGVSRALFVPLSLAVGFAMIGSFALSRTLVPILSIWSLTGAHGVRGLEREAASRMQRLKERYGGLLRQLSRRRRAIFPAYALGALGLALILSHAVGQEIFPNVDLGELTMRIRAPAGTAIEETEKITHRVLDITSSEAGPGNLDSSIAFIGTQPASFPVNTIFLWTAGPQEAVLEIALRPHSGIRIAEFREKLRRRFQSELPEARISFEASGMINRIMSQGSPTPVEISVSGPDFAQDREFAGKVKDALAGLPELRDLQYGQIFEYPSIGVNINRRTAGLMGLTVEKIGHAITPATSSSRYVLRTYWADPKTGITHQIQVQVPPGQLASVEDIRKLPVSVNGGAIPLGRVAQVVPTETLGEIDRLNMQRSISITANIAGDDLGKAAELIQEKLDELRGRMPASVSVELHGQIEPMHEMFKGLRWGLLVAVLTIFLLLAANFESLALSFTVLSTVPAVIVGAGLVLWLTSTTLNVESFMGCIMAIGVAVANAILLVTFAERARRAGHAPLEAAIEGAKGRLRPILMTSIAMIMGMMPMAFGLSEGSQQTAPLGRAVIGGLLLSTFATLLFLPLVYASIQKFRPKGSASLDPDDTESAHYAK